VAQVARIQCDGLRPEFVFWRTPNPIQSVRAWACFGSRAEQAD
jgi:hypothetical protein